MCIQACAISSCNIDLDQLRSRATGSVPSSNNGSCGLPPHRLGVLGQFVRLPSDGKVSAEGAAAEKRAEYWQTRNANTEREPFTNG